MNIILLEVGGQLFGIDAGRVVQVGDPPPVTPVPFLPDRIEGLVNVGGSVMVSVDLARALDEGAAAAGGGVSMVVRAARGAFALRVGRVLMMVPVEPADLHPVAAAEGGTAGGLVAAEFPWQGRMVLMLDPDRFDLGEIAAEAAGQAGGEVHTLGGEVPAAAVDTTELRPWLVVEVDGERYALDVRGVTEVVEADGFLPVPKAPSHVLGYHSLRGQPLLVVSLARLLALPPGRPRQVVVVGDRGGGALGLGVDRVAGIRSFDARAADEVSDATGAVAGCLVEGSGVMLAILDLDHVLTATIRRGLAEYMPRSEASGAAAPTAASATRRLLTFWLGDELCGIDLEAVSRVAEYQEAGALPADGGLRLDGVTQIGNEVMPLIDLRHRRGCAAAAPPLARVVARIDGGACALAVDRMHRIIDLREDDIRAVDETGGDLVSAVGRADGRLVSVLAVDHLLAARA